ncbi:MAG: hypothetical protein ACOCXT_02400 [Candidatus Dojkabacteria bacterium]
MKKQIVYTCFFSAALFFSGLSIVSAETYNSNDSSYRLELSENSIGYDGNNPGAADQHSEFKLSGSVEVFDGGYGDTTQTGDFKIKSGLQPTFEANVPELSVLTNDDSDVQLYDKLVFTINPNGNPVTADGTYFAVQISTTSDFSTFNYVNPTNFQPDIVTASDLSIYFKPCAQTTTDPLDDNRWDCGNISGLKRYIQGLETNVTYYVRVTAMNGDFTHSEPGPALSATTASIILYLALDSNASEFGALKSGQVNTASPATQVTARTNAQNGYTVSIQGTGDGVTPESGLYASAVNYLLASTSGNLSAMTDAEGYGIFADQISGSSAIDPKWDQGQAGRDATYVGQLMSASSEVLFQNANPTDATGDIIQTNYLATTSLTSPASKGYQDILIFTIHAHF